MIVTTGRGRIHVHTTGDTGTPVLMLHPLALSGAVWDPVAAHLGAHHRVVAPDARGHGESGWDGGEFTIEDLAADAAAVIETMFPGPAHVVGLSMGGSTALVLAATRPELVGRLVLADTTASYGPDRVAKWAERARTAARVPREKQLDFQRDRWFGEEFRSTRADEVERVAKIFVGTDSLAHAAACRAFGGMDATALLPRITAPTLVLVGDEDYATPPAMARTIAGAVPGSTLRILPGTRHLSLIERPGLWPVLAAFLADAEAGGTA